ncbi:MAG: D-alanyl-D-alanine carboxypeptidase [Actinomycetota bacterium]|nr:D-alanyl-D-alanine carboxypeptidase [Actinomycetota bacterium]
MHLVTARRRRTRLLGTLVVALALVLGGGPGAHAFDWPRDPALRPVPESLVTTADAEAAMVAKLDSILPAGGLGTAFSLRVVDVESGRVIADRNGTKARIAASNTKLFTAVAALDVLGKDARFTTAVRRKGASKNVTLVGGGDMRLTNGKLRSLATQTADALRAKAPARTKGKRLVRVRLDDSRYQGTVTKLKTWRDGGYNLRTIQPVRSVMRTAGKYQDAAASAGKYLAKQLDKLLPRAWVVRYDGRTVAPRKAKKVATVSSPKLGTLVTRMLLVSDNQVAEGLLREIALARGYRPTFAAGAHVASQVAASYGVDMRKARLADGSGLSVRNTLTPRALTGVLGAIADADNTALLPILYGAGALPVAGESGTLAKDVYYRFQQPEAHCAVGQVVAKTGSLDWERALSGLTVGQDGRLKAFSVVANKLKSSADRRTAVTTLDHVAAVVHGCATG